MNFKKIAHYLALLVMIFSIGIVSSQKRWWPAPLFEEAYIAYEAQQEQKKILQGFKKKTRGKKSRHAGRVSHYKKEKAYNGFNLLCKNDLRPILVDMKGDIVHRWRIRFRRIWRHLPHIRRPVPNNAVACVAAHLYPDGSILAVLHGNGDTPYGYGLVKLDAKSRVIWRYSQRVHHDVHVANNGDVYTLTHRFLRKRIKGLEYLHYPVLADYLVILDKNGKKKKVISLLHALRNTPYEYMLEERLDTVIKRRLSYDITHANSIKPLEKDMAKHFPQFTEGDILISMRVNNHLAVVNPKKEKVIWAAKGSWHGQHDAHFLKDGTILFFDNRGLLKSKKRKYSRIAKLNPKSKKITWSFDGGKGQHYYTKNKGDVDPLPNGNFLIASTDSRKMLEVTPKKELVWRYRIKTEIPIIRRYAPEYFNKAFCKKIRCKKQ